MVARDFTAQPNAVLYLEYSGVHVMEKMPPFMVSTGLIPKILGRIQEAKEPDDRYTQNFQDTVLGYGSGQAKTFIPFLKRMGFLEPDGRPTAIYKQFRNPDTAKGAMARAMRIGFKDIFDRNEYAFELSDEKLRNLLVEMTGKDKASSTVQKIVATFKACKAFADFDDEGSLAAPAVEEVEIKSKPYLPDVSEAPRREARLNAPVGMSFGYHIHLNLPDTDDPKVFNAIFSALKETLLKE